MLKEGLEVSLHNKVRFFAMALYNFLLSLIPSLLRSISKGGGQHREAGHQRRPAEASEHCDGNGG